jgi:septal ring factor EnvC (AmiA/AmiB activator)
MFSATLKMKPSPFTPEVQSILLKKLKNTFNPLSDEDREFEDKKINAILMSDYVGLCFIFHKQVQMLKNKCVRQDTYLDANELFLERSRKDEEELEKKVEGLKDEVDSLKEHIEWQKSVINKYDEAIRKVLKVNEEKRVEIDTLTQIVNNQSELMFNMNKRLLEKDHVIASYERDIISKYIK